MKEYVILVNEQDEPQGLMEKMEAHEKGLLHRAFSVLIFNTNGEMLIQQRAKGKYHSPLLWTNATCSHPRQGETVEEAAIRRLDEEMGLKLKKLTFLNTFIYQAPFDNGLIEHELDHVFMATTDVVPNINKEEVEDYAYWPLDKLKTDMKENPETYTPWFKILMTNFEEPIQQYANSIL